MFGGLAFMLGGHMFCGVVKDTLVLRLGRRPCPGPAACAAGGLHRAPHERHGLRRARRPARHRAAHWVAAAAEYARGLPPRQPPPPPASADAIPTATGG